MVRSGRARMPGDVPAARPRTIGGGALMVVLSTRSTSRTASTTTPDALPVELEHHDPGLLRHVAGSPRRLRRSTTGTAPPS